MSAGSEWIDWLASRFEIAASELDLAVEGSFQRGLVGRTLGAAVRAANGEPRWLRVVADRARWARGPGWTGNLEANTVDGVARPMVEAIREWEIDGGRVRAELMDMAPSPALSAEMTPPGGLKLDPAWWTSLRESLTNLSHHATDRVCLDETFASRRIENQLGITIALSGVRWTTAHGDLHWANLTGPHCWLLDWEAWGRAPAGYDVSSLLVASLESPTIVQQIRAAFPDELAGPSGHVAQLAAAAKMIELTRRGHYPKLVVPVKEFVAQLLRAAAT